MPEHAHDWPVLSLFVMGGYSNETDLGETFIAGPSAILYQPGASHRNSVASEGFEQIEIEFDPAWLGDAQLPSAPVTRWLGGRIGTEAARLARVCNCEKLNEKSLRAEIQQFVKSASRETEPDIPIWLPTIVRRLRADRALGVRILAQGVNRHPSWLGTAYRRATGEGLMKTVARFRVEHAARLLRETDASSACIALDAGFCDQSHMNRTFRRILGRRPTAVREDRRYFR